MKHEYAHQTEPLPAATVEAVCSVSQPYPPKVTVFLLCFPTQPYPPKVTVFLLCFPTLPSQGNCLSALFPNLTLAR